MKLKQNFHLREIAGESVLIPMGETMKEFSGLISLNEMAAFLWIRLEEAEGAEDLTRSVMEEYEGDEKKIRQDIEGMIRDLRLAEILA